MPISSKAAILRRQGGKSTLECLSVPDPGPGQLLVRAIACACCHSDESARNGAYPIPLPVVLGHEMAGSSKPSARERRILRPATRS